MTDDPNAQMDSVKSQYYFRALICFAASGTLASQLNLSDIDFFKAGTIFFSLIYIYIAYRICRRVGAEKLPEVVRWLGCADSMLLGFILALSSFTLLPTLLFVTMVQFNALLNGGGKKWAHDNLAMTAGIALGLLVYKPQWILSTQLNISLASLIGILTYFCASAFYTYSQIANLRKQTDLLNREKNTFKIRAYKLSRYISPPVWSAINEGRDSTLQTERKRLTIFFSDIKDFSQLSEELEAEALTDILNTYLKEMSMIVSQFGGTIDKFMGDGIMVIFGDNQSKGIKNDTVQCVSMALAMRKKMKVLQKQWQDQGIKRPMQIRMGINTGYCTVGTFGTSHHLDYTVLGTHVNLASRLESAASPDEILVTHETWSLCRETIMCRDKGEIGVKGFSHPIKVYSVVGLRKDLGKNQNYFEHSLDGFSMHLDMDKVRNYDRERAIKALEAAADALRDKVI
ncbi:adenylate/guanylate cyclase domain-containing protein [Aestuariicella sp. G3-2]|uniref:adenylate/guanylate cyclase domain-containing protein n=1 Tax=Pseudomaricurvus albidus TaxID=2842452 RepID=UPI001C0AA026|nr:adenylate/guanylate cyclase domain-containing protein [Aestuariicella albida]MBU3070821.1 adenylate/guanylate cyclase domain-containing protein [Aestuariicella albida]